MPESSFNSQNQVTATETRSGRFLTESLLRRLVARDVELMDIAQRGGPPSSTPAESAIQRQGDIVHTVNATIGGIIYCDSFTINPGVTVTVDRFLILICRGEVTAHGWLNADGAGQAGGVRGNPGTDGVAGLTAGGGGGRADTGADGGKGGDGAFGLSGGAGGTGTDAGKHGGVGASHTAMSKSFVLAGIRQWLLGGAGGGGGGDSGGDGRGGRGGGTIIIESDAISITTNGKISANGQDGYWGGTSNGGGGGGGGGLISARCKSWTQTGVLSATGGVGGLTSGGGTWGYGGAGAAGIIQVDVFG